MENPELGFIRKEMKNSRQLVSLLASLLLLALVQSMSIDVLTVQKWTGFSQLSEVRELKLNGKDISKINVNTFSGMINLEVLDLSRNMITSLPVSVFKGNPFKIDKKKIKF